jgi:hypothetical protein
MTEQILCTLAFSPLDPACWIAIFLYCATFLFRKTMQNRKPPTEYEIKNWLADGHLALPPLSFRLRKVRPSYSDHRYWDYEVEAEWGPQTATFAVECKTLSTPKVFEEALRRCRDTDLPDGVLPLLLMPYLRPSQLAELEANNVSGLDWCQNGIVIARDKFQVFRSGSPNQFTSESAIKNIYRRNTSMVARLLLIIPEVASVSELLAEVNRRNVLAAATGKPLMTMGTVSKALKQLEGDLIIERGGRIQILQAKKLLDQLAKNYVAPEAIPLRLKVDSRFDLLPDLIRSKIGDEVPVVATGLSSVHRYAAMQREEVLRLYCPDAGRVQTLLGGRETDRFPNVELIETTEQSLYFDARGESGFQWASPVQTWLELMQGDKRDHDAAAQVQDYLRRGIGGDRWSK